MNGDVIKVSIITVVFNEESNIETTIKSVIDLKDDNIEYIIIDGGSTDGTIDVLRKYQDYITCWISEADKGIYDAMNKAVDMAKGVWITNINAGDKLLSIPIDDLNIAECKYYDAVCGCILIDDSKIIHPRFNWTINIFNSLPHQGLYYKRESLYSKYELKYKIFSDYAYNIGMYKRKQRVYLITEILAFHSISGVSNTPNSSKELFEVIYNKCGLFFLILSFVYFKFQGLLNRIDKLRSYV